MKLFHRITSVFLTVLIALVAVAVSAPTIPAQAKGEMWELVETKIDPPGGTDEYTGSSVMRKINATEMGVTITSSQDTVSWSTNERINWVITSTFWFTFDKPLDTMMSGEVVTIKITGEVTGSGSMSKVPEQYCRERLDLYCVLSGKSSQVESLWQGASATESAKTFEVSYGEGQVTRSFSFVVPEASTNDEVIKLSIYIGGIPDGAIIRTYHPAADDGVKLELYYSNPLTYFERGSGDLFATLKDKDGKPIEGKTIVFFIDKEFPAVSEPGKNLFEVLDYRTRIGGGLITRIEESHPYLKKKIIDPELDPSLLNENRIFIGQGIRTDVNGEALINLIEYDILDPRKFSSELLPQRATFLDKGKISGNIIAGVYNEETKLLENQTSLEIEYKALAKILQITGDGRDDDPELEQKYPGKVRVKRFTALPHFEFKPVYEGFLLMPGDVVDIDGNTTVEIAWVNGGKVIARVPDEIPIGTVREPYKPPEAQIWILSSAYDAGFLFPGEKIQSEVFVFGAKKGLELFIQSIPYVGKVLKEGGALAVAIYKGLQDIDLSQTDIVTRVRIRSKVIIDNTGEDLKVYNLEGSPDIQTVTGDEVTLEEGKMVAVSDEGDLGEVQSFNVKVVEKEYGEITMAASRDNSSSSENSSNITGSGWFLWIVIGVIAIAVVSVALFVVRKIRA